MNDDDDFEKRARKALSRCYDLGEIAGVYTEALKWLWVLPLLLLASVVIDRVRGVPVSAAHGALLLVWARAWFVRRARREDFERMGKAPL